QSYFKVGACCSSALMNAIAVAGLGSELSASAAPPTQHARTPKARNERTDSPRGSPPPRRRRGRGNPLYPKVDRSRGRDQSSASRGHAPSAQPCAALQRHHHTVANRPWEESFPAAKSLLPSRAPARQRRPAPMKDIAPLLTKRDPARG